MVRIKIIYCSLLIVRDFDLSYLQWDDILESAKNRKPV